MNSELLEKFQAARKPQISARFKNLSVGWREIGGKRMFFRSRWEANYCHYLQWLLENGEIKEWQHEPERFTFNLKCGKREYIPDFRVVEKSGRIVYCECKGFYDWRSKRKLKWMKQYYPKTTLFIADGKWFKKHSKTLSKKIHGWETK